MQEVWKSIKGFEGIYEVSNFGRVRSIDRIDCSGRHLKAKVISSKSKCNYITCVLMKCGNRYTYRIHRLVAEAFIPNPLNLPVVNHIDGNKKNNHASNLEWCSYSENTKHAYKIGMQSQKRKLHDVDIIEILKNKGRLSCTQLAKIYGVSFQLICKIWKVGGRP